jgi:CRP/FNR family transcriptional regulator, cyclic AMP receptor protein
VFCRIGDQTGRSSSPVEAALAASLLTDGKILSNVTFVTFGVQLWYTAAIVGRDNFLDPTDLSKLRTLSWIPAERLTHLACSVQLMRVRRPQTIFSQGEASSRIYVMLSGVAKLSIENCHERVLVGLVGPGEIFGVSSLLPNTSRPFRCNAFTDCRLAIAKPEAFIEAALGIQPADLGRMLDVTVGRWWGMLTQYANLVGCGLRERLANALWQIGTKFGVQESRGILLTLKLTHGDLADLVGASRQRITIQLKEFERERLLIRDGRRIIIVPDKLLGIGKAGSLLERSLNGNFLDVGEQICRGKRSESSLSGSRSAG